MIQTVGTLVAMDAIANDDFDCVRGCTYVVEAEELAAIVERVEATRGTDAASVYQRFHQIVRRAEPSSASLILKKGAVTLQYVHLPGLLRHAQLSRYQEQAQLLDPHLSSIVEPLAAVLRETAEANLSGDTSAIVAVSQMLWAVATIRSVRCPPAFPVFSALPKPDF